MNQAQIEKDGQAAMKLAKEIVKGLPKDINPRQASFALMNAAAIVLCNMGESAQAAAPATMAILIETENEGPHKI